MAEGKLSTIKGMDCMGRVTMSMTGGMMRMTLAKGALKGFVLGGGGGVVAGMVSYVMGSSIGEKVYSTIKKVAQGAKKTNIKGI